MRKLYLFVVRPSDNKEEVQKKFMDYLEKQGVKIIKEKKNKKNNAAKDTRLKLKK